MTYTHGHHESVIGLEKTANKREQMKGSARCGENLEFI